MALVLYLRGRHASCMYNETMSTSYAVRTGVPQRSVMSPTLFSLFVSNYPHNVELQTSYAVDVNAAHSFSSPQEVADVLTVHAESVREWTEERSLRISLLKSHVTLFTSDTHQCDLHPTVTLDNSPLPLEGYSKVHGVTLNTHFSFLQYVLTVNK